MMFFPGVDVPEHALKEMKEKYNMSNENIRHALQYYLMEVFEEWDIGVVSFSDFLEMDKKGDGEFTNLNKEEDEKE